MAGGEEGLAIPRGHSRELSWDEVREYAPEYLMIMPCAFGPERSRQEAQDKLTVLPGWEELPAVRDGTGLRVRRAHPQPPRAASSGRAGGAGGSAAPGAVRRACAVGGVRPGAFCLTTENTEGTEIFSDYFEIPLRPLWLSKPGKSDRRAWGVLGL